MTKNLIAENLAATAAGRQLLDEYPELKAQNPLALKVAVQLLERQKSNQNDGQSLSQAGGSAIADAEAARAAMRQILGRQGVSFTNVCRWLAPKPQNRVDAERFLLITQLLEVLGYDQSFVSVAAAEAPNMLIPVGADGLGIAQSRAMYTKLALSRDARAHFVHGCMGRGAIGDGRLEVIDLDIAAGARAELTLIARSAEGAPLMREVRISLGKGSRLKLNEGYIFGGDSCLRLNMQAGSNPKVDAVLLLREPMITSAISSVVYGGDDFSVSQNRAEYISGKPLDDHGREILKNFPPEYALELQLLLE